MTAGLTYFSKLNAVMTDDTITCLVGDEPSGLTTMIVMMIDEEEN